MGQYFDIVLRNGKTGEEKVVRDFTFKTGRDAWKYATARAWDELEAVWSPDGDAKHWFLLSITDYRKFHKDELAFCEKQLVWWTNELEEVNKKRLPEARKEDREFLKWADERGLDYGGKYVGEDTAYLLRWRRTCYKWKRHYAEEIEHHKQKLAENAKRA